MRQHSRNQSWLRRQHPSLILWLQHLSIRIFKPQRERIAEPKVLPDHRRLPILQVAPRCFDHVPHFGFDLTRSFFGCDINVWCEARSALSIDEDEVNETSKLLQVWWHREIVLELRLEKLEIFGNLVRDERGDVEENFLLIKRWLLVALDDVAKLRWMRL